MRTFPSPRIPARWSALSSLAVLLFFASPAYATPGGSPLESFGRNIVSFMSGTLGPIVLAIGLGFAAAGIIFGLPNGLQRALMAGVGGILLVFAQPIAELLLGWGGR